MALPHTYPGDVDRVLTVAELVDRIERQCTPHKRDSPNGGRGLPEVEPVAELINPHCAPSFESRRSSLATERVSRIEVLQGRGVSPRRDELDKKLGAESISISATMRPNRSQRRRHQPRLLRRRHPHLPPYPEDRSPPIRDLKPSRLTQRNADRVWQ